MVKSEGTCAIAPPPCTSFTPVKSPDQKRAKPNAPEPASDRQLLKRSLAGEMESVANSNESPAEPTQLDSTIEKSAEKPVPWFLQYIYILYNIYIYIILKCCNPIEICILNVLIL